MTMNKMKKLLGLLAVAAISAPVHAQAIDFWHSDTVWAGQGMCAASFTFDRGPLSSLIQNLQVTFNAVDAKNKVVDTVTLEIDALGGSEANRYASAGWESEHACDSDLRLQVISANALIDGQQQDLLAKGDIGARAFIPFQITIPAPRAQPNAKSTID